jgi:TPR repeat protein
MFAVFLGLALAGRAGALDEEGAPPDLAKATHAYEQAQMSGDRAALERLLADDYMLVSSGGGREGKAEFIGDLTAPDFKLKPYVIQAHVLRAWAGGAVSAGVARQTGTSGGQPFDACIRYADTWKLERGAWRVVFTQVARAPAPGPEGCKAP